ncbi:MAG: AAA family ATPase [bacterium]|nr:AAA family ATPase [bacterium]
MTIHLHSVTRPQKPLPDAFPFNIPVIRSLTELSFTADVTFLVGENGSGKSTLLEAAACAAGLPTIGADNADSDPTLADMRRLANALQWSWKKKTRRGFFMRSEDFFGFVRRISRMQADLNAELKLIERDFAGRGSAADLAELPVRNELHALRALYGDGLDAQSHGESYFKLFRARFVPDGLYLLDEPEAPLSPTRQLILIALIAQYVQHGAQFIIATHSPLLLAYPGALILSFDGGVIVPTAYDALEHVTVTRTFLRDPEMYLRHLVTPADDAHSPP